MSSSVEVVIANPDFIDKHGPVHIEERIVNAFDYVGTLKQRSRSRRVESLEQRWLMATSPMYCPTSSIDPEFDG